MPAAGALRPNFSQNERSAVPVSRAGELGEGSACKAKVGPARGQLDRPVRPGRGSGAAELTRRAAFFAALEDVFNMKNMA